MPQSSFSRRALCLVTGLGVLLAGFPNLARGDEAAKVTDTFEEGHDEDTKAEEYERVMRLGLRAYDEGHWAVARALFLKGHGILPNARSLRVLGMTDFNLGLFVDATRELSAALHDPRRPLTEELSVETRALLEQANAHVGLYHLQLEPKGAQLWVDGTRAKREPNGDLMLVVGEHRLEAEAPNRVPIIRPLVVDGTDGQVLRFHLMPATDSAGFLEDYRFTLATTAAALAFSGAAVIVDQEMRSEEHRLRQACPDQNCFPKDHMTTKYHRLESVRGGMIAASAAMAVTAIVLFFVERTKKRWREESFSLRGSTLRARF